MLLLEDLIPAGTGRMTTEYEKVALKDKEIIEQNNPKNLENLE